MNAKTRPLFSLSAATTETLLDCCTITSPPHICNTSQFSTIILFLEAPDVDSLIISTSLAVGRLFLDLSARVVVLKSLFSAWPAACQLLSLLFTRRLDIWRGIEKTHVSRRTSLPSDEFFLTRLLTGHLGSFGTRSDIPTFAGTWSQPL